jgi:carboxyl-terminal processing protease
MNNPMKKKINLYLPIILSVVLASGVYLGYRLSRLNGQPAAIFNMPSHKSGKLDHIFRYIQRDYVDEVDVPELEKLAISAMLEKLDPHSQYITAEEFNEMNDPLLGSFEGIGVSFRIEHDTITVINPLKGGPSERVGIMPGDRIVNIDDSLVAGVSVTNRDAMSKLKGKRGTQVRVDIFRRGVEGLIPFTITRDVIPTYSLDIAYMPDEEIGYIKLNKFSATTYNEFLEAARKLKQQGMEKLILDLRGNSGGYLKAATDIADEFLENGKLIVYTEGKSRPRQFAFASKKGLLEEAEVFVLIDEGSASASEIVAGALQDNDRGTIIGRRSFGKGLVQEQLTMGDGSAIRLTVSRYYTPTGRSIQKPYDGDFESYHHEPFDRYINGEMMEEDSIPLADSLKFETPGGKIVYGGGGIMPDIFVPMAGDTNLVYFNRIANRGLVFQYAFDYADRNRPALNAYGNFADFNRNFRVNANEFNKMVDWLTEKGVTATADEIAYSKEHIITLFKAFLGRNVFDDEGFYPIYHQIDPIFQKALSEIKQNNRV